jgi:hypothetical protein
MDAPWLILTLTWPVKAEIRRGFLAGNYPLLTRTDLVTAVRLPCIFAVGNKVSSKS